MATGVSLLIIIFLAIAFIVVASAYWKLHPFVGLLLASFAVGIFVGVPLPDIIQSINNGFGGLMGYIGLIVVFGSIIGVILERSGAAMKIADLVLNLVGNGKWDHLIAQKWNKGLFYSPDNKIEFDLQPYQYKMLRAIDFYRFAEKKLARHANIFWKKTEVLAVNKNDLLEIKCKENLYQAELIFDSRIPNDFFEKNDNYIRLLQHFKGWFIHSEKEIFNSGEFTMMDYRLRWKDSTSFVYILPLNKKEALVEFTFFSPDLVKEEDYDFMLKKYLQEKLSINNYKITETEQGIIPMSDFNFNKYSSENHIYIGTAGGWVKPSSGYSFKFCEKNAQKIIENIKSKRPVNSGIFRPRFRFYDSIFLNVLNQRNDLGPDIFSTMYFKNNIQKIFAFLDEETSFWQEIKIMSKFQKGIFTKSFFQILFRQ